MATLVVLGLVIGSGANSIRSELATGAEELVVDGSVVIV